MLNVGIVGAAGYTGEVLIELLLAHPQVRITHVSRKSKEAQKIQDIFPRFRGKIDLWCGPADAKKIAASCDLAFLALPHTASMEVVPRLLKMGTRVVDLSADYRFLDAKTYEKYYKVSHKDRLHLAQAVYGLPELYRNRIKGARLVANPGCYPSAAIIALAPALALNLVEPDSVIIDAKSGVTGAGKKIEEGFMFSEVDEDFKAYKVNAHQHMPEIEQVLSKVARKRIKVTFVPHLLPLRRGILATIYARKSKKHKAASCLKLYRAFYKKEPFVRIREEGAFPRLADVAGTNFCDIGIKEEKSSLIIIAAIDNLMKGASGQAVQNMNIMYKFPERSGLS